LEALWLRQRTEHWARDLVTRTREGALQPAPDEALYAIAFHRDTEDRLLTTEAAGVELLNVLRPIVAIANYVVHLALALHRNPAWRLRVRAQPPAARALAQEVRRMAPFFPFIGGIAQVPFHWDGSRFPAGQWVLLDLYGTDRDPHLWAHPDSFIPERFEDFEDDGFTLVPQGAGEGATGHRCPGEGLTLEAMVRAARRLATADLEVPPQDLSVDLGRMPALPRDGFIVRLA
ncbi:MAG: cytochrome P450, partial [Alphaproteobacteria bacterium]|nr:cytochrome P450 [Alphaproteobacteria bacterium]